MRVIPAIQVCVGATKKDVDALLKALQGRDFRFGQKRPDFLHQTRAAYFLAPQLKRERSLLPFAGSGEGWSLEVVDQDHGSTPISPE